MLPLLHDEELAGLEFGDMALGNFADPWSIQRLDSMIFCPETIQK